MDRPAIHREYPLVNDMAQRGPKPQGANQQMSQFGPCFMITYTPAARLIVADEEGSVVVTFAVDDSINNLLLKPRTVLRLEGRVLA